MKHLFAIVTVLTFLLIDAHAQVEQFTSDMQVKAKLYSATPETFNNNVSITIDNDHKKIIVDSGKVSTFVFRSTDTSAKAGYILIQYHSVDPTGSPRFILFIKYPADQVQLIGSPGILQLHYDNNISYSYTLHRKE